MSTTPQDENKDAITTIFNIYSSLSFKLPPKQFTVLAAFWLSTIKCHHAPNHSASDCEDSSSNSFSFKVISIATGTKCTPAIRYSPRGEMLHDTHAEVLSRRGALRWFLEEIIRIKTLEGYISPWLARTENSSLDSDTNPPYRLHDHVELNMYVSTLPCGDASMRYLASIQDQTMATLKSQSTHLFPTLKPKEASRGRDNYNRLGVLRTKPGRADSPPALSMSCSDKMAKWNVVGIQGGFGSKFLEPIYIGRLFIGEIPKEEWLRSVIWEDCKRAFCERVKEVEGLPNGYTVHTPKLYFTDIPFIHSKTELDKLTKTMGSCNESLCWVADSKPAEVVINGLKRSTSIKNRYNEKYRLLLSRIAFFQLYSQTLISQDQLPIPDALRYGDAKALSQRYQQAKKALCGSEGDGPFSGWIKIELQHQSFAINGELIT